MTRLALLAAVLAGLSLPAVALEPTDRTPDAAPGSADPRAMTTAAREMNHSTSGSEVSPRQWAVQLAGSFSEEQALAAFSQLRARRAELVGDREPVVVQTPYGNRGRAAFYRVRLQVSSRTAATELCDSLHASGESCVVLADR
ncbi:SPOR domain-containing protein [Microvirga massiliensis]|uniref:SPOR domain-containing protein n=1 Tax=Microvirga massiliensis TaxID=1033741 RepID=UPI00062BA228|nr:SPOR domain-containing protein [Microvirga massiliensis]